MPGDSEEFDLDGGLEIFDGMVGLWSGSFRGCSFRALILELVGYFCCEAVNGVDAPLRDSPISPRLCRDNSTQGDRIKNKDEVSSLLKSADSHLSGGGALGYGRYKNIRVEIASIQSKVEAGTIRPDFFERVKHFLHDIIHGNKA
jgi:hypothetical protein